jgi:hypothetical protein
VSARRAEELAALRGEVARLAGQLAELAARQDADRADIGDGLDQVLAILEPRGSQPGRRGSARRARGRGGHLRVVGDGPR